METIFDTPPPSVQNDLDALNHSLNLKIPSKTSTNLLIATWNIRKYGGLTRKWLPSGNYSPKRDLRALRLIADILYRFDVIAVQEVVGNLRALRDTIKYLGNNWSFLMTDVTIGDAGNHERLAYIFDNTRLKPSGLAGEVVIPPEWIKGLPQEEVVQRQFVRTPYAVSFKAGQETFILLTAHVDYGASSDDRIQELKWVAKWMYDWAKRSNKYHHNLVVLGDFNIDRKDDELWKAFTSTNLYVPEDLHNVKRSIFIKEGEDPQLGKFYDQIAWFHSDSGKSQLKMEYIRGGGFDFLPYSYSDLSLSKMSLSHRLSDHYPLWVEFRRKP